MKYNKLILLLAMVPSIQMYSSQEAAPAVPSARYGSFVGERNAPDAPDASVMNRIVKRNAPSSELPSSPLPMDLSHLAPVASYNEMIANKYDDFYNLIERFVKLKESSYDNMTQSYKQSLEINDNLAQLIANKAVELNASRDTAIKNSVEQDENKIKRIDPEFFDRIQTIKESLVSLRQ